MSQHVDNQSQTGHRGNSLVKSDIEVLTGRLKAVNEENEDLLARLSETKRKKKRRRREFEDQCIHLFHRIDELEAEKLELLETVSRLTGEMISFKDQFEEELAETRSRLGEEERRLRDTEEREQNFKEQLEIVRKQVRDKEVLRSELDDQTEKLRQTEELADAVNLENTKLKDELEEYSRLADQIRRENNSLKQQTTESSELEQDFRLQKQLMLTALEGETEKANKAAAETEVVKETARANEDTLREKINHLGELLREKEQALENEIVGKWRIQAEKDEKIREAAEKEVELRSQIDELMKTMEENKRISDEEESARNVELKEELDRLMTLLVAQGKRHEDSIVEKEAEHAAEITRLGEEWKAKVEALEHKLHQDKAMHGDQISTTLNNNKKMSEELGRKTQECSQLENQLANCRSELEECRRRSAAMTDEDKLGKLERALVRLKLENDQLRSTKKEGGAKDLLREKESHIIDLQREVSALRSSVKKYQTDGAAETRRAAADDKITQEKYKEVLMAHRKLLDETIRLRAALDGGTSQDPAVLVELFEARKKLKASSSRVEQLENWLDEIYSIDPSAGVAPRSAILNSSVALPELKNQTRTVKKLSKPKWQTVSKSDKIQI